MRRHFQTVTAIIALLGMFLASACASASTPEAANTSEPTQEATTDAQAAEPEFQDFDPGNFDNSTDINNEWMPMQPGTRWVHEGTAVDDDGNIITRRIEFTVTDLTKEIAGVRTVVAWIVDHNDNEVVEKEIAFYAQDKDGNVWYLGEYPEEYDDGEFVKASPWIHGFEDARAGIKMMAEPQIGIPRYYQGWGPAVDWSDYGQIDQMGQETCVAVDCYQDVMVIAESSLGEVDAYQLKYYARGVGEVRVGWKGADATREGLELIELVQLSPEELAEVHAMALELEKHAFEISKDVYVKTSPAEQISFASSSPEVSPTPQASPTPKQPLLTGQTTMCDLGANLINFRVVEPFPDLTDKTLIVEIADIETTCAVNPTNLSLLTCKIPPLVTFPAGVVVSLDGAIVNDFTYEGIGCDELTTPIPTTP